MARTMRLLGTTGPVSILSQHRWGRVGSRARGGHSTNTSARARAMRGRVVVRSMGMGNNNDDDELDAKLKDKPQQEETLAEAFAAGKDLGKYIVNRFARPVVDDPGLPIADALVCIASTAFFSTVILAAGLPRPSWLVAAPWVPKWRSLPFVFPAIQHGSWLAMCWIAGAVAGQNYEEAAYKGTRGEALKRTLKSGAFASGVLILCYQALTSLAFMRNGLPPFPGETLEGDLIFARMQTELVADIALQAVSLVTWRQIRWKVLPEENE